MTKIIYISIFSLFGLFVCNALPQSDAMTYFFPTPLLSIELPPIKTTNEESNTSPLEILPSGKSPKPPITCEDGFHKDDDGNCVPDDNDPNPPDECEDGFHKDDGNCVPDERENENQPPTANVGKDIKVKSYENIVIDGSKSEDSEGKSLYYKWLIDGIEQEGYTDKILELAAPYVTEDTKYSIELIVNDGELDSEPDKMTLTIQADKVDDNGGSSGNGGGYDYDSTYTNRPNYDYGYSYSNTTDTLSDAPGTGLNATNIAIEPKTNVTIMFVTSNGTIIQVPGLAMNSSTIKAMQDMLTYYYNYSSLTNTSNIF